MESIIFHQPRYLGEAIQLLHETPNPALLAGGTDLIIDINKERKKVETVIDLSRIEVLKTITVNEIEIEIGSMVTFANLCENPIIKQEFFGLFLCAKHFAAPQIRNMATIGGNIINASAAADSVPVIMSLEGKFVFNSVEGERIICAVEYFSNYEKEKIKPHEVLTKIKLPRKGYLSGFYKLGKRNSLAIARINAAVSLKEKEGVVENINIALGAVGRYPFRVTEIEKICVEKPLSYLESDEVLIGLETAVYESIKNRPTMPFKKEAVKGVYILALQSALGGELNG